MVTAHVGARFSCFFHILLTSHTLQDSHVGALCSKDTEYGIWNMEKSLFMEQSKAEEDLKWRSATPASRFRTEKSPSNKNLPNMMLKTKFPFLYGSTSLDTKALTIASNRNFESCLSIRCLAPQHIFRFFQFGAGISFASGNFALYCVVLLNAPLSDRDQKKKKCVCNTRYFSRKILIHRH